MGLYSSLSEKKEKRKYSDLELFRRYLKRIIPYKKNIILISIFILISTLAEIINPLLLGYIVDELSAGSGNIFLMILAGIGYTSLSIVIWIMFYARIKELGKFVPYFLEELRMDIFDKIQEQDMRFFDNYQSGELNSRVLNDALDFGDTTHLITETLANLLISVLTFVILLWLNLFLALITLAAIPFLFLLMLSLRRLARKVSRRYRSSIEDVNKAMVESIEGILVSKSYGQEAKVSSNFEEINKNYFLSAFKLTATTHMWRPLLDVVSSITLVIVLYFSSQLVAQDIERPGLSSGMAAYERILDVLNSEPRVQQNPTKLEDEKLEGDIKFKNIDFYYNENNFIFKNLNLEIQKGEKLAIVGHTGAGKTSLVSLLTRFYEFQGGEIFIDRKDIRQIPLEVLRKNIGLVQQEIFLFSGTIEDNIRYGKRDASKKELWNAIRTVHAEELISYLPEGLDTHVGERGRGLSTGQRQLISFARAVLSDPSILILDEATSSVDAYTETIIQEALEELLKDRTSIIIAHRLSTVIDADRIIVMDQGKIVEEGTHQNLLKKGGKYMELYRKYFEHQSIDWHEEPKN
ncbi:MAG: putative multidrug export ATP-binding/permease protein [Promethearchaeota archaeon]|nr:MAG: putative multidrug export ATP-binding/permease protein [Candidatus Lokiarchaeota archaeon]